MPFNPYSPYPQAPYAQPSFPYPNQSPQMMAPQANTYAFVNGVEGAKSFQVAPNQSVMLMDSEQPIAYKKTANGMGQASIQYFRLTEISEEEARGRKAQPASEYVLKTDFDALAKKVDSLLPKEAK